MKIIVDQFLNAALAHHNRNINNLILCSRFYININALHICFAYNFYMGRTLPLRCSTVGPNIKSTVRHTV